MIQVRQKVEFSNRDGVRAASLFNKLSGQGWYLIVYLSTSANLLDDLAQF